MRHEIRGIGDGGQAVLCETRRAITPYGGLAVLVEYLRLGGVITAVRERLPFRYTSNNRLPPEHTLLAFWLGVAAGAHRFAQLQRLRCDGALQALCGVREFPCEDTVRNFFRWFGPPRSRTGSSRHRAMALRPTATAHLHGGSGFDRIPAVRPAGRRRAQL